MNLRKISFITSVVVSLTFLAAYAQDAPQNTANREPIENAAKKLYRGIANSDMATIFENTSQKYLNRKLTPNKLRLPETGPKVTVSWDDEVTIVRSDDKTAVVSTTVEIDSLAQLSRLMEKLEGVKDVHTVAREAS